MSLKDYTIIFGGSFDPPHSGHQAIIGWLINSLGAKEIIVCPTFQHCFGKQLSEFDRRLTMCDIMIEPFKHKCWVSDVEYSMPSPNLTANLLKTFVIVAETLLP